MTPDTSLPIYLLVYPNCHTHQHVLRSLHHSAIYSQEVGSLQRLQPIRFKAAARRKLKCTCLGYAAMIHLETKVVVVKIAVVDDLTV